MSVKKDKDAIIDEIRNLRTLISELDNADKKEEAQKKLNRIQDMVFQI